MSQSLSAPWRMDYIRSIDRHASGPCFLCAAAAAAGLSQRREGLVLWDSPLSVVLMNRFPYANGHLLIASKAHKPDPTDLTDDEAADLTRQTFRAVQLLRRAVSAQGFNIGMNVGRVAGAGVPGHIHQHVVPRWGGDVNFMQVVGEVRVIPEAITTLYDELLRVIAELPPVVAINAGNPSP
jgi:ATP adenylyltransferase